MNEELRPISGYEGLYSVTADGRVWSHPKQWRDFNDTLVSHAGKWLHPSVHNTRGYLVLSLHRDGKRKAHQLHRVVAAAWVPNPASKPAVNHINGIKTDNRAANLAWCTPSENMQHAYDIGLQTMTPAKRAALAKNHATGPRRPTTGRYHA